jgi:multidrug efflux pump subunit AcrA (membrane-fusion protein)
MPLSTQIDTAVVTRGTIADINQYTGIIRISSQALHFGSTNLRFGEFHVKVGEAVSEGQLLARLDVEHIEEALEDLLTEISATQMSHEANNDLIRSEIAILESEYIELVVAEEETAVVHGKIAQINLRSLDLDHALERQALIMRDLEVQVEYLNEQLADAELLAPYDGTITWLATLDFQGFIYPFQTIMSISDGEDVFIEYASGERLFFRPNIEPVVTALVGDQVIDLRLRALSDEESSRYLINQMAPPVRFDFNTPTHNLVPGAAVVIRHYVDTSWEALKVPASSVYSIFREPYVYVNNNGNKEMREIEVGIRNGAFVEVLSGLEEGDVVFVR